MMGIGLVLLGIFILFWFMVLANSDSVMIDFNRTLDDAFESLKDDPEAKTLAWQRDDESWPA